MNPTDETAGATEGSSSSDLLVKHITTEDFIKEGDRNYTLGRRHAKEEMDIELRAMAMALNKCRRLIRQLLKHRGHVAADLVMDRMAAMMDRD